ncbi:MAG: RagB/SusD family nutrient uptake outer membrane protein [Bacteroidetes bacterium]|nr:RagB/SusD family nutrient uptake outer membrane protein [Bacteroidota bacterium]
MDYDGFILALNGAYAEARREKETIRSSHTIQQMAQNGTDNLVTNHRASGFARIAADWGEQNNPSQVFYSDVFTWLYSIVNATNVIISEASKEGVDWTGGPASEKENQELVIAEARALRGWAYRHLSYGWGDVPLNLDPSNGTSIRSDWTRTPVEQVRDQMIADWSYAEQRISIEPRQAGTLTRGAVQHYLSETYLAQSRPDSALYWANQVINEPAYQLVTERYGVQATQPGVVFMDMFTDGNINRNEGNSEALWVFNYERNTIGGGGNNNSRRDHHSRYVNIKVDGVSPFSVTEDRGGRGFGRNSLTKWAIENWTPEDDRGSHFAIRRFFVLTEGVDKLPPGYNFGDTIFLDYSEDISTSNSDRVNWPWCRKVDWADPIDVGGSSSFKDFLYLRLAETYLLRAEAQVLLGQSEAAAESINIIRRRANATEITAADVDIDFILDERSRELVTEEHRRYTLLRTNKWLERTALHNARGGQFISERDRLFPIPQVVIDANLTEGMPQNPGY